MSASSKIPNYFMRGILWGYSVVLMKMEAFESFDKQFFDDLADLVSEKEVV